MLHTGDIGKWLPVGEVMLFDLKLAQFFESQQHFVQLSSTLFFFHHSCNLIYKLLHLLVWACFNK